MKPTTASGTAKRNGCERDLKYRCTAFWGWHSCLHFEREPKYNIPVCKWIRDFLCTNQAAIAAAEKESKNND